MARPTCAVVGANNAALSTPHPQTANMRERRHAKRAYHVAQQAGGAWVVETTHVLYKLTS